MNEDKKFQSINAQKTLNVFSKFTILIHKNHISKLIQKTKLTIKRNMVRYLLN